jgi:hypothetical protein
VSLYVIRNRLHAAQGETRLYLGVGQVYCGAVLRDAARFPSIGSALRCMCPDDPICEGREIVQISYGLRWCGNSSLDGHYFGRVGFPCWVKPRSEARRFDSSAEARAHAGENFFGALGPGDLAGWKVARFMKVVRK